MTYANMPREYVSKMSCDNWIKIARLCDYGNEWISLPRQTGESVTEILENINTDKNWYIRLIKPQL